MSNELLRSAHSRIVPLILSACLATPCRADPSSFTALGQLPGGTYGSNAVAISADGQFVVGLSDDDGGSGYWRGFVWTSATGMSALPLSLWPTGISADGTVVVGNIASEAARWAQATGLEPLGTLNGDVSSRATAISADGSTIVGSSAHVEEFCCDRWGFPYYETTETRAIVVDEAGRMRALPHSSPSYSFSSASAVSADGSAIAGSSSPEYGPTQACIWINRHPVELGDGQAYAISADGSVVVGKRLNDVFRWTDAGGMEALCWPGPFHNFGTLAVSADGSVIVGNNDLEALIWDAEKGARPLQDVLTYEYGLNLTGWTLTTAVDISDDGRTIVGTGTNPSGQSEAWMAELGDPLPRCPGDFNDDAAVNLGDLAALLAYFGTPDGAAYTQGDLDRDGDVDLSDLAGLLARFGTSCPTDPEPNVTGLGFLPNGYVSSSSGISADASTVVGTCYVAYGGGAYDHRAFRWTQAAGMIDLGALPGGTRAHAWGCSADGSVIVGQSNSSTGWYACRWIDGGAPQSLGAFPGGYSSQASDVSGDGSVIVGSADGAGGTRAFRWTSSEGMTSLGTLTGGTESFATDISADGSTVVGFGNAPGVNYRAFRWTNAESMVDLGALPGFGTSIAADVNEDGSVIVGESPAYDGFAFRWTSADGMVNLGTLPGDTSSSAMSASADGFTVLGISRGASGSRWFLWTPTSGMVDLGTLVVLPAGWWPQFGFNAMSADAGTLVGSGTHCGRSEAWIATLRR